MSKFFSTLLYCIFSTLIFGQNVGLITYNEDECFDGYVFFSSVDDEESYLIDNCGKLVNTWTGNDESGLSGNLMPNGKMLRVERTDNNCCPQYSVGGLIEMRDWDNNVEWSYRLSNQQRVQHHDFTLLENGNILVLGWEVVSPSEQEALGKSVISMPYFWGEFVYELKPLGSSNAEVVWEWHLKDHFVQDEFPSLDNFGVISENTGRFNVNYAGPAFSSTRDWFHCNAIDYNQDRDEIIINSRNVNECWIIDHSTTSEEAKSSEGGNRGKGGDFLFRWGNPEASKNGNLNELKMFGSHATHWIKPGLPNEGKILFFNNGDERPGGYYSTAEMIDPSIDSNGDYILGIDNKYQLNEHRILYGQVPFTLRSLYYSNVQQLENGNFFINEGGSGRLLEITDEGKVVWEYIIPLIKSTPISQGTNNYEPFKAYKYGPDYPGFIGQDLSAEEYIEPLSLELCETGGTLPDNDNDGWSDNIDCDDNDSSIGGPGTPCDDDNPNTINDLFNFNCNCGGDCIVFSAPSIDCNVGDGFINFNWAEDDNISNYLIALTVDNNTNQLLLSENFYLLDNVTDGQVVKFEMIAIDKSDCFSSLSSAECVGLVNTENIKRDILVYPNPVRNTLSIQNLSFEKVVCYDLNGKKFYLEIEGNKIDVRFLPTGLFVLLLKDGLGNELGITKFIKQ